MVAFIISAPYSQFFDNNGLPLNGGKVYTSITGTTTPLATYTDATGVTQVANPIVLDSSGRAAIWASGVYRFRVTDAAGNPIGPNGGITDGVTILNAGGDMTKAVYDPANIAQQLVGINAAQTLSNKTLDLTTTNFTNGAWTSYTPVITASLGTFASVTATGAYKTLGKTVFVEVVANIIGVGTAANNVYASLPFTASARPFIISGKENGSTGQSLTGEIASSGTVMNIRFYNGAFAVSNGYIFTMTGVYESV